MVEEIKIKRINSEDIRQLSKKRIHQMLLSMIWLAYFYTLAKMTKKQNKTKNPQTNKTTTTEPSSFMDSKLDRLRNIC